MSSKLTFIFAALLMMLAGVLHAAQTPLKPGDIIGIVVAGEADLSRTYSVQDDGAIVLPGDYGKVMVGGKTPAAAEEEVRAALRRYIKNPDVRLEPVKIKGVTIRIEGAVKSPGQVELQGDVSARDVLAFAGGPVPTADLSGVTIARDGKIIDVDLQKLKADTNPENKVMIQDGDIVTVPDKLIGNFTILGAVKAPGPYPLLRGMRVLEAITLAGGELEASKVTKAKIISSDQKTTQIVNLTDLKWKGAISENKVIMPGDTIVLEADSGEPGSYFVSGAVNKPGQIPLTQKLTVIQAIGMAGGATPNAKEDSVSLIRRQPDGSSKTIPVDLKKMMAQGSTEQIYVEDGDVINVPARSNKQNPLGPIIQTLGTLGWIFL